MGIRKSAGSGQALDPKALKDDLTTAANAAEVVYRCKLVTPMFGGGIKAGVVDEDKPIRATAIRGQLRFWWRLLHRRNDDGSLRSAKELFAAERVIWGGLGEVGPSENPLTRSKVRVSVQGVEGVAYKSADAKDFNDVSYAIFPAADIREKKVSGQPPRPAKLLAPGVRFDLHLDAVEALKDEQWRSVLKAVQWWAQFGGVGARTRRGMGAVEVRTDDRSLLPPPTPMEIARHGCVLHRIAASDAQKAWDYAITKFRDFRQGKGHGRDVGRDHPKRPNVKLPGRSRWPEPDAIRRLVGTYYKDASKDHSPRPGAGDVFPRALFGLPITTHFKDTENYANPRMVDPEDTELLPVPAGAQAAEERMASPLILRPVLYQGRWHAGALLLPRDHQVGMALELRRSDGRQVIEHLPAGTWWRPECAALVRPMTGHGDDPLVAFMAYFGNDVAKATAAAGAQDEQGATRYERPKLQLNRHTRSISVKPAAGGRAMLLQKEQAEKCLARLSADANKILQSGRAFECRWMKLDEERFIDLEEQEK